MNTRRAIVVGATGLVGRQLIESLLHDESFEDVTALVRRDFDRPPHPRLRVQRIDFDRLESLSLDATDAFCALGTTMKQAGSREAFRRVDFDYVVKFAKAVRPHAARFALVSALGADKHSVAFYNRVKGETEEAVSALGFDSCGIFRPSLLVGHREHSRLGERVGLAIGNLVAAVPIRAIQRARPIDGADVARAMVWWSHHAAHGVVTVNNDEMQEIARGNRVGVLNEHDSVSTRSS